MNLDNKTLAVSLLRFSYGIIFLFHGIVRLPNLGKFVSGMQNSFQDTILPSILVTPFAYAIPFIEVGIGVLFILNKYTRENIIITFILLNMLIIGSSVLQDWPSVAVKLTYISFLSLLLYCTNDNQATNKK